MKTLIWKDYRNCYPLVVVGAGVFLLPYIIWVVQCLYMNSQMPAGEPWLEMAAGMLVIAAMASLICSQLVILILGAQIIAGERALRTSEFLFYLPPSRQKILSGKLAFSAIFIALVWAIGLIVFVLALRTTTDMYEASGRLWETLMVTGCVGIALFGAAWAGSSALPSPTYCAGLSVVVAVLVYLLVILSRHYLGVPSENANLVYVYSGIYLAVGLAGIIGGWIYFLQRAEP